MTMIRDRGAAARLVLPCLALTALLAPALSTAGDAAGPASPPSAPSSAKTAADPRPAALRSCMRAAAARLGFHGVVRARREDELVEMAFGTADAQGSVPIAPGTAFDIGSAGKMFTAVLVGRLVDRGALAWDAPVGRYLAHLPPAIGAITIAQLLNHTSGLGDYLDPAHRDAIEAARSARDLLPLALAAPPAFAPGTRRAYSNSGFVVLGAVIEQVTGLRYDEAARREIFEPLGMSATRLDGVGAATAMTRMSPGGPLALPRVSPFDGQRASPAGGAISTAGDLSRFLDALQAGRLVRPATLAALLMPRPDPGGRPGTYGYGFNVRPAAPKRVGHGGGAPGINAEVALYPESGWQLIALSNGDPPAASRMVDALEAGLFAADPAAGCNASLANVPASSS